MSYIKKLLSAFAATAMIASVAGAASADGYPEKEITFLVNYGPGGSVDRTARSLQPFLPDALGQQVIVENVGGAAGKVGLKKFMAAPRDGYTVLVAFAPATTYGKFSSPGLFEMDDLAIINVQWVDPGILLAQKDTGWKNIDDMIKYAKANPGKVTFGSSGRGSVGTILAIELFDALGLDVKIVPYKGGGATRKAFAGGEVDLTGAGAGGATSVQDVSVAMGLFDEAGSAPDWPDAPSVNAELKKYNYDIQVMDGGSYRFFAVHSDVKKNHPDRYKKLVDSFKATVTENAAFKAAADKAKIATTWRGPEKSQALIQDVDDRFSKVLKKQQ